MAGDSANSDSTPRKRLKTVVEKEEATEENRGLGENSGVERMSCAICYTEDWKAIRGEIDSCDHYYCFLCIMEWAKTESRCPMCRQRFSIIRRLSKPGTCLPERLINVPVRDQVHYGDADGSYDPYVEVLCNVCHETTDDNLLLLCDLCDSGAHTYCVGLGYTVPEGDWFCHDCTISRTQHPNSETKTEDDNQNSTRSDVTNVTIQESCSPVVERPPSRVSSDSNRLPSLAVPRRGASATREATGSGVRTVPVIAKKSTESGARTVDICRNVHSRIRALRENWSAFQRGSLSFSSSSSKPRCYNEKHEVHVESCDRSSQAESSPSTSCELSKNEVGIRSCDIHKAWKMMDIAKSKQVDRGKTSNLESSKPPLSKAIASKERTNVNLDYLVKSQQLGIRNSGRTGMEKPFKPCSFGKEMIKNRSPELEREKQSSVSIKEEAGCSSSLSKTYSHRLFEPSLSMNVFTSTGDNTPKENRSIENVNRASSNIASAQRSSSSAFRARQGTSDSFDVKQELRSSKVNVLKGDTRLKNSSAESKARKHDDAKSEIQSLVKLNLKLLSRDKHLGHATFKEIARVATHTILAAFGLEHKEKYGLYSFPSFVCSHTDLSKTKSNTVAESCRECFYKFVKNVVNFIMLERVDCTKLS